MFKPGMVHLFLNGEKYYQHVDNLPSQFHHLVYQRPCHVLSRLCDNACKRSLAICYKSSLCHNYGTSCDESRSEYNISGSCGCENNIQ